MQGSSLYEFYEKALLPQFGINEGTAIAWDGSQDVGPDETVHYFNIGEDAYALIFEDHDGHGKNDGFIREHVLERHSRYQFVPPTSETGNSPSYYGFQLPTPYQYCPNVTGTFTLIKLQT